MPVLNLILPILAARPCQIYKAELHFHKRSNINNISLAGSYKN